MDSLDQKTAAQDDDPSTGITHVAASSALLSWHLTATATRGILPHRCAWVAVRNEMR
jgi:hypothetical protein